MGYFQRTFNVKYVSVKHRKWNAELVSKLYCILGQWLYYRGIARSFPNRVISWSTFDHFTDGINPVSLLFLGFSLNKGSTYKSFEVRIDFQDRVLGEVRLPSWQHYRIVSTRNTWLTDCSDSIQPNRRFLVFQFSWNRGVEVNLNTIAIISHLVVSCSSQFWLLSNFFTNEFLNESNKMIFATKVTYLAKDWTQVACSAVS